MSTALLSDAWGIHWFRRDLRVDGNQALHENILSTGGRTVGLFCFDASFLDRADFSHNRFAFFIATLKSLKADLDALGIDLLVVDSLPLKAFDKILAQASARPGVNGPSFVSFGRDYEPFAVDRDQGVQKRLEDSGVQVLTFRDHLLFEPWELRRTDSEDSFYKVYSPFAKRWAKELHSSEGQGRLDLAFKKPQGAKSRKLVWQDIKRGLDLDWTDQLEAFAGKNQKNVTVPIPAAGHKAALKKISEFHRILPHYDRDRSIPALDGSSKLSFFLKNGSTTLAQVMSELKLGKVDLEASGGPPKFTKELVWREFFYSILFHRPDVERGPFVEKYSALRWDNNLSFFDAWKNGRTGVPIVDAGMRELASTGWINNRVRIIVATFLIKDLHVDWRWGERHFMNLLLDGDLANNNGNWQWCASTGADANPYFRVLSPWSQSLRFDPDGTYIKHFVPELAGARAEELHDEDADRSRFKYQKPIVSHSVQRKKAIASFKA